MFGLVNPNVIMYNTKKEYVGVGIIQVVEESFPIAEPLFWVEAPSFKDGDIWVPEQSKIANMADFETPRIQARRKGGKGPNVL